jgi:hypothetical protein
MPPRRKRKQTTSKHSVKAETQAETANATSIQPAAEEVRVLPVVADIELVEQASKKSKTDGADAVVQKEGETAAQEPARKLAKLPHGDEARRDEEDAQESNLSSEDNSFVVATAAAVAAQALAAGEVVDHDICQIALKDDPPPLDAKIDFYGAQRTPGQAVAASRWNRKFEELKAYEAEHGNVLVPAKFSENQALATWVSNAHHTHPNVFILLKYCTES